MSATYPLLFIWGNAVFKYLKWSVPSIKDGSWYGCIFSQAMRDERLLIPTLSAAAAAATAAKCPNLCDPIDGSPPGSAIPGILQARTLEWVAISFSKAWKWKVKVKFLSHVRLLATPWTAAYQAPPSMGFFRQKYWSGVPLPSPTLSESQFRKRNKWVFDHLKEIKFFPWKLKEFISMNSQGQSWIFDFNFFFFFAGGLEFAVMLLCRCCCCCCCWVASVMSDSVWPHRWQLTRLCRPWNSPGKNTGVGCHFLLQWCYSTVHFRTNWYVWSSLLVVHVCIHDSNY